MCNIGDTEPLALCKETTPTARKQHICCECGSSIELGEKYQRVEGMLCGKFITFKTCEFCSKVRAKADYYVAGWGFDGIPFTELWECVGMDYAAQNSPEF